jgi:hypothetical protein
MAITQMWKFRSNSNPKILYETLEHDGERLTCNCPGWCNKKNTLDRTCRHVRSVQAGIANEECEAKIDYRTGTSKSRKFFMDPTKKTPEISNPVHKKRRISW